MRRGGAVVDRPTPLAKPVYTAKEIRACVGKWVEYLGFHPPWKIGVVICNSKKQQYCDESDPLVYGSCEPSWEYKRMTLRFDPWHPSFEGEELDEVVRHELFHALVNSYTAQAQHNAANDAVRAMLESSEEDLVTWLSTLPVFAKVP